MTSSDIKDFQQFIRHDPQLKAFGQCIHHVNLFELSSDSNEGHYSQRPNRTALVVDGECCLDRFYGGYFPDWSCGGQWQNMMGFLSALFSNCRQANVHLAIFYNGAIEPERFPTWVHSQLKRKQHVKQVLKHLTKRMTPPPKAFWTPPPAVHTLLRLALKSLNMTVYNSLEDHHQEIMAFCWENTYHGVLSDDGEFAFFNPVRLFSAHDLKLSFNQELETTEYDLDQVAKSLDLNPNRFSMVASLLGCHILKKEAGLVEFHRRLVPELKAAEEGKYKIGHERVIRAVVNYVRALPSIEDYSVIAKDVFGEEKNDARVKLLKESVQYFDRGTKDGHANDRQNKGQSGKKEHKPNQNISTPDDETRHETKETDLVERIALDLDKLDLSVESDLVQAVASGVEIAASAEGKYPDEKPSIKPINIPLPPTEVKRTASERHRQGQMSPYVYQILTKGEIKLPVVIESDVLPPVHAFFQPLRQRVYAILCNLHHARFDRRTMELRIKGMRQKADELRKKAKKLCDSTDEKEREEKIQTMKDEAARMMKEASETVLPEITDFVIREWQPYNDYKVPLTLSATELPWPAPTVQRLWFGNSNEDKQKRLQTFLSCMFCEELAHGKLMPHLIILATVLRYIFVHGSNENPVLKKPELDAFLVTALSPELYNIEYLAQLKLQMVTIRGVHLASLFMQGVDMALLANDSCGEPIPIQMCMPWTFFDGKLFHSKLIKATQARNLLELCDGRGEIAFQVEKMRNIILAGLVKTPSSSSRRSHPNAAIWRAPKKSNPPTSNTKVTKSEKSESQARVEVNEDTADVVLESETADAVLDSES